MRIGIIGVGQIGGTLTRRLTALGHQVIVANSRGPETLSDLAAETGATAVSVPEAVRGVDLVVVTIPEKNISDLPPGLFAATPDRVVVIDTGNYYPRQRDGRIEAIEAGLPESQWVAQQLGRPVIKAFNNIYARHLLELGRPRGTAGRIALPVAGDDAAAKNIVLKLIDELGFDGVDAGGLDGTPFGGKKLSRGALYLMLQNRIHRGEITHKGNAYPADHQPIVDKVLWYQVQTILAENRVRSGHRSGCETAEPPRRPDL
jgi:8-hydroxy-5-deazaflavin:NADPH oxidoreductase